jgi:hypothetical protein
VASAYPGTTSTTTSFTSTVMYGGIPAYQPMMMQPMMMQPQPQIQVYYQ